MEGDISLLSEEQEREEYRWRFNLIARKYPNVAVPMLNFQNDPLSEIKEMYRVHIRQVQDYERRRDTLRLLTGIFLSTYLAAEEARNQRLEERIEHEKLTLEFKTKENEISSGDILTFYF